MNETDAGYDLRMESRQVAKRQMMLLRFLGHWAVTGVIPCRSLVVNLMVRPKFEEAIASLSWQQRTTDREPEFPSVWLQGGCQWLARSTKIFRRNRWHSTKLSRSRSARTGTDQDHTASFVPERRFFAFAGKSSSLLPPKHVREGNDESESPKGSVFDLQPSGSQVSDARFGIRRAGKENELCVPLSITD